MSANQRASEALVGRAVAQQFGFKLRAISDKSIVDEAREWA